MTSAFEHAYPFLPVWAQHAAVTLYGVSWRRERLGGCFAQHVEEFAGRDRWDEERMQEHVTEALRGVLARALADVPYYRQSLAASGLEAADIQSFVPDLLSRLPVTPKDDVRRNPWSFVSESASRPHLRRYLTSGSTGTPVTAICGVADHRRFIAAREARSFRWAGTTMRGSRSMIGGRMVVPPLQQGPPYHRFNAAERQVYFSAFHISPANARFYVAALNRYRPAVLTGYACSHVLLARMTLEQGLRLEYRPQALILSSEKLTGEMKETLASAFGARAFEEYGAVENCALATECEAGSLHVSPDFGVVEIVDEEGRPTPPGRPGRVLCTGLLNEAQLFVRYEIGDIAAWSDKPCPCGRRAFPVLREVLGRVEDVVVGPDGREMVRFHGIFVGLRTVREGQVVQKARDRFVVRVAPAGQLDPGEETQIVQRMRDRLGPVSVTVETVTEIQRTRHGKYRAVISEVAGDDYRMVAGGNHGH